MGKAVDDGAGVGNADGTVGNADGTVVGNAEGTGVGDTVRHDVLLATSE